MNKYFIFCLFSFLSSVYADYQPELFKSMNLVYESDFNVDGDIDTKQWMIRQHTTWTIVDGHLLGKPASKEYQEKKLASSDPTHAGLRPVIFLKPIPEEFVFQARILFEGEFSGYQRNQLSFGHHLQEFFFGEKDTKLILHKDKKNPKIMKDLLIPPGQWVEVTAEQKNGHFILMIDGKKKVFEDQVISMNKDSKTKSLQIDFKGLNHGSVKIDWVKVYQGVN